MTEIKIESRHCHKTFDLNEILAAPLVEARKQEAEFHRYAAHFAWETEVWIAGNSDHIIHFNGERFLAPYQH
jgi:hypothetical protein